MLEPRMVYARFVRQYHGRLGNIVEGHETFRTKDLAPLIVTIYCGTTQRNSHRGASKIQHDRRVFVDARGG